MQLWSQCFLTAPTLMANKQFGIPPSPSPKQIAIYISTGRLPESLRALYHKHAQWILAIWLAGWNPASTICIFGQNQPLKYLDMGKNHFRQLSACAADKWPIPLLHPQELLSKWISEVFQYLMTYRSPFYHKVELSIADLKNRPVNYWGKVL